MQAATSLPMFLLSLPAGAVADVLDRRRLLIVTQIWMTVAAYGLWACHARPCRPPAFLLFFTFLLGLGAALNGPAWQAIVPELVPREDLPAAVTLGSIGFNIARAAGPALGGLLVAAAGPAVDVPPQRRLLPRRGGGALPLAPAVGGGDAARGTLFRRHAHRPALRAPRAGGDRADRARQRLRALRQLAVGAPADGRPHRAQTGAGRLRHPPRPLSASARWRRRWSSPA